MAVIKCKMCGGDLNIIEGQSVAECEYCGSRQTVPTVDNEKKLTLFARANRLRAACEFDKAAGIYESIVADFPEEAEAYWGLVLCKYGIEYVDDPGTGRKIPTCHRSSFESIMDDANFEQATENADAVARKVYREEAKQIEEIRKGIIAVSSNEEPYDIFICYKETDENGDRTLDSVLAQDIYDALTDKGYRVFFSRITLEDKLGQEYEPYIFAALNSAKIMLAVGTDYEYFNAVWVKNEWSRYLKLMTADKSKYLIPCFKGIDAYDIPKEFAHLQGQDLGKVGAIQDLLRGVEKILPKAKPAQNAVQEKVIVQGGASAGGPDTSSLLKRAFMFLEDGNWKSADEYCEKVLDIDPENAQAYLGKLMAELRANTSDQLKDQVKPFDQLNNYRKILRFGDESMIRKLNADLATIQRRIEQKRKQEEIEAERNRQKEEQERAQRQQKLQEEEAIRQRERQKYIEKLAKRREELRKLEGILKVGMFHTMGLNTDGTLKSQSFFYNPLNDRGARNVSDWFEIAAFDTCDSHSVGLKYDGTVVATKHIDCKESYLKYTGECEVSAWRNIAAICVGNGCSIGLRSDGTVVATKYTGDYYHGQCEVSSWRDIVAIYAGCGCTIGIKTDGTVVSTKYTGSTSFYHGQCEVTGWQDIVAVSTSDSCTVGLKADGTVVATEYIGDRKFYYGQCDVSDWKDIVAISTSGQHTVGLKSDGTVVAVGYNKDAKCNVSGWKDIVAISIDAEHTVGLKLDGTVVATGSNKSGQCNVSAWQDIVAVVAGNQRTVGLKSDGTVVITAYTDSANSKYYCNQSPLSFWKLFRSFSDIEQEHIEAKQEADYRAQKRREAETLQKKRREDGLCQHCGGQFKGLFGKKCVNCGKPKDY